MALQRDNPLAQIKLKRPSASAFKQQRLPAWQPVLTARTVLPVFFVIGIAFIPVGIALLYFSNEVREHVIDYTDCVKFNADPTNTTCSDFINANPFDSCVCVIDFQLDQNFTGNVYMYYGLSNYYQNHRLYVKSRDDDQLLGHFSPYPSPDCGEQFDHNEYQNYSKTIVPCGAIANSLFNDSMELMSLQYGEVNLLNTGIAWPSDKKLKFHNPPGSLQEALKGYDKPKSWKKNLWELDPNNEDNNGLENEDLIVWMRSAALPSFRKLYRRIDHSKKYFENGLPKGKYTLTINYNYSVSKFGSKTIILSTTSVMGGKNPFLGIAYIVVGCVCLLLGIALLVVHVKYSSVTDVIYVNPASPF